MSPAEYKPLLFGTGFSGFRSFATWQAFHFLTKVTVLAGINNCGKSNVLRFLQQVVPRLRSSGESLDARHPAAVELDALDVPPGYRLPTNLEVGVLVPGEPVAVQPESLGSYQREVMDGLREPDGSYWSRFVLTGNQFSVDESRLGLAIASSANWPGRYEAALRALGGGKVNPEDVMRLVITSIGGFRDLPNIVTITGSRRVEAAEDLEPDWLSGRGIIKALAELQNPTHDKWDDSRARWSAINGVSPDRAW